VGADARRTDDVTWGLVDPGILERLVALVHRTPVPDGAAGQPTAADPGSVADPAVTER